MAARLQPRHIEEVREKIKASQLVNALQNRVFGKNKMDAVAVQAARTLLAKIIPDLKAVEHSAGDGSVVAPAVLIVSAKQNA